MRMSTDILNKYVFIKQKYVRTNQGGFMTKVLNKAIMKWLRLCNKFLKEKSFDTRTGYNKQKHYCLDLLLRNKDIINMN